MIRFEDNTLTNDEQLSLVVAATEAWKAWINEPVGLRGPAPDYPVIMEWIVEAVWVGGAEWWMLDFTGQQGPLVLADEDQLYALGFQRGAFRGHPHLSGWASVMADLGSAAAVFGCAVLPWSLDELDRLGHSRNIAYDRARGAGLDEDLAGVAANRALLVEIAASLPRHRPEPL